MNRPETTIMETLGAASSELSAIESLLEKAGFLHEVVDTRNRFVDPKQQASTHSPLDSSGG